LENLGKAPDTALWDGKTAHEISALPAQKETKTNRRVFESVSPALFQSLPLVGNETQKKIGGGEVQESLGSWKQAKLIRVWRMLLAEIFRLMVRMEELRGNGCLGWKSFFAGLVWALQTVLRHLVGWRWWGVECFWLEVGARVGEFWLFSIFWRNRHGMVLWFYTQGKQEKDWEVSSGI
jgi:hypothetical protein